MPTCFRCEKAEIACQGYQRDAIFVNRTPENLSITALSVLKQNNIDLHVSRDFDQTLHLLNSQVQSPIGPRTQFRLQALGLLKKLYLPQPSQADIRETSLFSWLQIICELEGISHALDYSLLTFCVIQVAITKSGSVGIDEALQVYNDALQILQVEIQDISAGQSDEILAAISVLSSGEVILSLPFSLYTLQSSNRFSYLSALLMIPGALMPMAFQKSFAFEMNAWIPPRRSGQASALESELFLYAYWLF